MNELIPFGFKVRYQPRVNLASGLISSAEALARFPDGNNGLLPTAKTIAEIECSSYLDEFTLALAERVANDIIAMKNYPQSISINISPLSLQDPSFIERLHNIFVDRSICPNRVEFEITETDVNNDVDAFLDSCIRIRQLGHHLSIDDFGTGSSSLIRLDMIPATAIKIDRHFVSGIRFRDTSRHIISLVAMFASNLGLSCIAEGVETQEELDFIRSAGCTDVQGYFYYPPLSISDFMHEVEKNAMEHNSIYHGRPMQSNRRNNSCTYVSQLCDCCGQKSLTSTTA